MTLKTLLDNLREDCQGILLSTDLMLSLVIITITLGISAHTMDMILNPLQDYSMRSDVEKTAIEAADILINTPGSPANWETLNKTYIRSPGLVEVDPMSGEPRPHVLSYKKISMLKSNYHELIEDNVFPEYIGSSIAIYPVNRTLEPIILNEDPVPAQTSEIVTVNRTVMCDFQYLNCTLQINSSDENYSSLINHREICSHELHDPESNLNNNSGHSEPPKSKWICKHFCLNASNLNTTDYYLIFENNGVTQDPACWILDRPELMDEEEMTFSAEPIKLNEKIFQLIGNEKQAVLWLHVKSNEDSEKSFNVYIVAVPKNTDIKYVKTVYLTPQPCYFVLRIWLK